MTRGARDREESRRGRSKENSDGDGVIDAQSAY